MRLDAHRQAPFHKQRHREKKRGERSADKQNSPSNKQQQNKGADKQTDPSNKPQQNKHKAPQEKESKDKQNNRATNDTKGARLLCHCSSPSSSRTGEALPSECLQKSEISSDQLEENAINRPLSTTEAAKGVECNWYVIG